MSLDPTSLVFMIVSASPFFYIRWASLNCFCRKTESDPSPEATSFTEEGTGLSRHVSEDTDDCSPRSYKSSIDSQLVSWERLQQDPDVWNE